MSDDQPAPHPKRTLATRLGVLTVAAILIDLGTIHSWHQADSLLPALVSTLRWTFYYWEQNRYGMLTALLARPFENPFVNLLVQNGITIWAGLATFPLAATYFGMKKPWLRGLVAAAVYVVITPQLIQWTYLSTANIFSVSLAFGLAGLIVVSDERKSWTMRLGAAFGCFLLGSWVNSALGLMLAPLALLVPAGRRLCGEFRNESIAASRLRRLGTDPALRRISLGLVLCGFGIFSAMVMQRTTTYRTTWVVLPPIKEWASQFERAWETILHDSSPTTNWSVLGMIAFYNLFQGLRYWNSVRNVEDRRAFVIPVVVFIGCAAYVALMTILFSGRWRYAAPALMLVHAAIVCCFVDLLTRHWSNRRTSLAEKLAALLLFACIVVVWGLPSASRAKQVVMEKNGSGVAELLESRATHVTGDYWKVWPAVFCTNQHYADRGEDRLLWGVSHRSKPTARFWLTVPPRERRVASFVGDEENERYHAEFDAEFRVVEVFGPIEIRITSR